MFIQTAPNVLLWCLLTLFICSTYGILIYYPYFCVLLHFLLIHSSSNIMKIGWVRAPKLQRRFYKKWERLFNKKTCLSLKVCVVPRTSWHLEFLTHFPTVSVTSNTFSSAAVSHQVVPESAAIVWAPTPTAGGELPSL